MSLLSQGGTVLVTPMSGQLLFSPAGPHYLGGAPGGHCVESGLQFTATRGTVLTGTVTPAIAGVVVTLSGGKDNYAYSLIFCFIIKNH